MGKEVLIVDDCEDIADACGLALHALLGCDVRWVADGADGLAAVAARRPDVIVLDMMMPNVDGLEFLERLPAVTAAPPPVLAYSGFDRFAELARVRGAAACLQKPFELDDLVRGVSTLFAGATPPPARPTTTARAVAAEERERFWRGAPALGAELSRSLGWLVCGAARYFGAARAFVTALHDGGLHVLAVHGAEAAHPVGSAMEPRINFCPDVIDAGTPLVLRDCTTSPAFASHPASATGVRFYAGAPLVGGSGVALGTFCLEHLEPRAFAAEDLALVRDIAAVVVDAIERDARGDAWTAPYVADGIAHPALLEVILDAEMRRAERDGASVEVALFGRDVAASLERMAKAPHERGVVAVVGTNGEDARVRMDRLARAHAPAARVCYRPRCDTLTSPRALLASLDA